MQDMLIESCGTTLSLAGLSTNHTMSPVQVLSKRTTYMRLPTRCLRCCYVLMASSRQAFLVESALDWGLASPCLEFLTCLCMMEWFTADFLWVLLRSFHI